MKKLFAVLAALLTLSAAEAIAQRNPVIDVHLHSYTEVPPGMRAEWADRADARALTAPASAEQHMRATLAEMDRYNVVLGVVSGPEASIRAWHEAAPGRFIGGAFLSDDGLPEHSVDSLRTLVEEGTIGVLGELGLQYAGIAPDDPRLDRPSEPSCSETRMATRVSRNQRYSVAAASDMATSARKAAWVGVSM
jgi:hypothetical protein